MTAAGPASPPELDPWSEVLLAWALAMGAVWAAWRTLPAAAAPFAGAAAWMGVAAGAHIRARRPLAAMGIAWHAPLRSLKLVAAYGVAVLPLYAAGLIFLGGPLLGEREWRVPPLDPLPAAFMGHLAFAALPEEVFFRGFIQPRLAEWGGGGAARRVAGAPLSRAVVATAALFALSHVAFLPDPLSLAALERLTTFFPGLLFGALREESGDVATPALFHALCNAWQETVFQGFRP